MQAGPTERPTRFVERPAAAALLLVGAAAVFAAVSLRPYTHSEARYVEAGWEMATRGDWIVPHLSFVPYFEKPVLFYWLEAASQLAFGLNPLAARLPSILAGLAMTWTTYATAASMRGRAFGLGAAALLASSVMFSEMSSAPITDPVLSAFLVAAWYAFWRHDRAPTGRWIWAFWTWLGLAWMTKGPIAAVLVGASVGPYLLLDGRLRDVLKMRLVRGVAVVAAINLPWTIAVWRRDPRLVEFFYVRENFQAFSNGHINHAGPPYFYVPWLLGAFLPLALLAAWAFGSDIWTSIAPATMRLFGRGDRAPPERARLFLACVVLPPALFLSVSASKLGYYVLPLLPAMAILAAGHVADRLANPPAVLRRVTLVQACVLLAVAAAAPFALARSHPEWIDFAKREAWPLGIAGAAMLVPMLVGGVAMARGRMLRGMIVVAAGGLVALLVVNLAEGDVVAESRAGGIVAQMMRVRRPGERFIVAGPMSDDYSIVLTTRERPEIWGAAKELGMGHFVEAVPPPTPIPDDPTKIDGANCLQNKWLLDDAGLRAAWNGPARAWLVARERDVARMKELGLTSYVFAKGDDLVVTNLPPP